VDLFFNVAVYPRWRGEHAKSIFSGAKFIGLSPLARGTPFMHLDIRGAARFIPAGAGNTT